MHKKIIILILTSLIYFTSYSPVYAGLGISPSFIKENHLKPGSTIQKNITLSRSEANQNIQVFIKTNLNQAKDWFEFTPGKEFTLAKNIHQKTITFTIKIPEKVELKKYQGIINITTRNLEQNSQNITIDQSININYELNITNTDLNKLLVRSLDFTNTQNNNIDLTMKIENQGNTIIGPERVELEIRNLKRQPVTRINNQNTLPKINPSQTKNIIANFNTQIPEGEYFSNIKIYFNNNIIKEDTLFLKTSPSKEENKQTEILGLSTKPESVKSTKNITIIFITITIILITITLKILIKKLLS